jgi:hypothetical protein
MRHVAEHECTDKLLKSWAGESQLAKAMFYFWASGSEEKRSQTGLLRYLLHQLLAYDCELTPRVFPDLWQNLSVMSTRDRIRLRVDWSVLKLMDCFRRFLKHTLPSMKICLFVGGLDEFDGDHQSIIHFFRDLSEGDTQTRIKMCLSSRP